MVGLVSEFDGKDLILRGILMIRLGIRIWGGCAGW